MYRILLIGDSITGGFPNSVAGYAPEVCELLAGAAQVGTLPENGGDSRNLLLHLSDWLGDMHYDVIHFNCGLHDIKRPQNGADIQVPIHEYEANLHALVDRLQVHATGLIWARTTPVVDGQPAASKDFDRFNADIDAYNRVADRVMAARGVTVDDLRAAVCAAGLATCLAGDGVHMTVAGNHVLARQVAALLRTNLSALG